MKDYFTRKCKLFMDVDISKESDLYATEYVSNCFLYYCF